MDAARCRPPRSYAEVGLRKVSGHVDWASCRNPEVVRHRHHGISNEKSAWRKRGAVECRASRGFRAARLWTVGSEEARLRASLRPPLKLHVRFSRMQLSRRHMT